MPAASSTRTRLPAAERREQILEATRAVVDSDGFHAVTMDAVARAAGITRPVVYGHFNDLQGLLSALVERESVRALTQLAAIVPTDRSSGDPSDQLLGALNSFLEAVAVDPVTWRLVLMPPEGAPESLHEAIAAGRGAIGAQLATFAAPGVGGAGPPDPELTATILQAVSEEYARLLLEAPDRYPIARLAEHASWSLGRLIG